MSNLFFCSSQSRRVTCDSKFVVDFTRPAPSNPATHSPLSHCKREFLLWCMKKKKKGGSWWWSPRGVFAPTLEGSLSRFQKDFFCLTNATRAYVEFAPKCQRSLNVHFSSIHKDGVLSLGVWFEHQLQSAWDSDRMKCFHEGLWLEDMEAPVWLDFQECDVPVMKMSRITQTGGKKSIL